MISRKLDKMRTTDENNYGDRYKYRWIVLVLSLLVNALSWGCVCSVGIYYVRWIEYFRSSKADVAFVGGLPSGTSCICGPLFGIIICRIGFRKSGIIGVSMMAIGHLASIFATNLIYLGFFYGIIFGAGSGLCYYAASVGLNCYFVSNNRPLAEGLMASGGGIGAFAFSHLTQHLITEYNWMGAMAIVAAIILNVVMLFQLMIPPKHLKQFPKLENWKLHIKIQNNTDDIVIESVNKKDFRFEEERANSEAKNRGWLVQSRDLYSTPIFILILSVEFFTWLCIFIPYVHLAERSRLLEIDEDTTAWIFSMIGLTGIIGRPVISFLPTLLNIDEFYIYGIITIVLGIITAMSPLFANVAGLFAYASVFGFLDACNALGKSCAAKLLGHEQFAVAYSWMLLYQGIAVYIGPFLVGWIADVTLSYDYALYCMGCCLIFSGLLVTLKNSAFRLQNHLRTRSIYRK